MNITKNDFRGFSLVEVLAVVAIMSIVMAFSLPLFSNMNKSNELRAASALVLNVFQEAQQEAIVRNSRVEVRFYEEYPLKAEQPVFNATQYFIVDDYHGKTIPQIQKTYLPKSVVIHPSPVFSSLLDYQNIQRDFIKKNMEKEGNYLAFYFLPSGAAFLTTTKGTKTSPFITLTYRVDFERNAEVLKNFVTIQIDPPTGRVQVYK